MAASSSIEATVKLVDMIQRNIVVLLWALKGVR